MTIQRGRQKSYPGAQSQLRQLHLKASSADLVPGCKLIKHYARIPKGVQSSDDFHPSR